MALTEDERWIQVEGMLSLWPRVVLLATVSNGQKLNGGQGPGTSMYVFSMLGIIVQASNVVSRLAFVLRGIWAGIFVQSCSSVPNISYPFNSTNQFECADNILDFERAFSPGFRSKKG